MSDTLQHTLDCEKYAVVSGTETLTLGPLNAVCCEEEPLRITHTVYGSDLFVQHILQLLGRIEIFFMVAWCIILLKEAMTAREHNG